MVEKLTVTKGPMFSSKTLRLIEAAENAKVSGKDVRVFKPVEDDRGEGPDKVKSRFGAEWDAIAIGHSRQILEHLQDHNLDPDLVLIDEIQFIDDTDEKGNYNIVQVVDELLERNVQVHAFGLPRDFRKQPFGAMPQLLARAQKVIETFAICTHDEGDRQCNRPATETQRFVGEQPASWHDPVKLIGDVEEGYAARCIRDHKVKDKPGNIYESE